MVETTFYWSRVPGKFVNKRTGVALQFATLGPTFQGTVREWYETLVETLIDMRNELVRERPVDDQAKPAIHVDAGPMVQTILETSMSWKPNHPMLITWLPVEASYAGTINRDIFIYSVDGGDPELRVQVGESRGIVKVLDL